MAIRQRRWPDSYLNRETFYRVAGGTAAVIGAGALAEANQGLYNFGRQGVRAASDWAARQGDQIREWRREKKVEQRQRQQEKKEEEREAGQPSAVAKSYRMGGGTGYGGKSYGRRQKVSTNQYDRYGITAEYEVTGSVTSQNVNWLGAQSYVLTRSIPNLAMAMLRFIYRRYLGYTFQSTSDYLDHRPNTYQSIITVSEEYDTAGTGPARVEYNYTVSGSTETLTDFGNWFLSTVFAAAPKRSVDHVAYNINMRQYTGLVGTGAYVQLFNVNTRDLRIKGYSYNHLVVQNSTLTDAGSTSTDQVDSNPLVGKIYYLENGTNPLLKNSFIRSQVGTDFWLTGSTGILPVNQLDGMLLPVIPGAPNYGPINPASPFNSVPGPEVFYKVGKCYTVNLAPGQSKLFKLGWKCVGSIDYILNKFYTDIPVNTAINGQTAARHGSLGRCMLIALENRVLGTSNTAVKYHLDQYYGWCVTSAGRTIVPRTFDVAPGRSTQPYVPTLLAGAALKRSFAVAVTDADVRVLTDNRSTVEDNQTTDASAASGARALKRTRRRVQIAEDAEEEPSS